MPFVVCRFLHRSLFIVLLLLATLPAFAQFDWQDGGKSIRQGLHLGWNGAMIASGNDDVTLFYYDCRRDGSRDIWGNRLTASGVRRWGTDGQLVSEHISEQRYPVLAAYPDGSVLVVWEDYAPGRYRDLFAQRYDEQGNALWSPASGLTVVEFIRDQFEPFVAIDENGFAYITFTDDRETNGANVRLGAYGQVLSPTGERIGPLGGIQLVDRLWGANVPNAIITEDGAAYVLISGHSGGDVDLILQKILPTGEIVWPEDPAILTTDDSPHPVMIKTAGGMAIGWTDRSNDLNGDAHLALIDYNREFRPGWPNTGRVIQGGEGSQSVVALLEANDGDILAATGFYDYDIDGSLLSIQRLNPLGQTVHEAVEFGPAALGSSPVDMLADGDQIMVAWTERFDVNNYTVRTQRLTENGAKLWGNDGNSLWTRERKELRCDLVKPANGPARLAIVTGRSIARPESLWVGALNSQGRLTAEPELFGGGITYDIYDPQIARIDDETAIMAWTDARLRPSRDLYIQVTDGQGTPQLALEGQAITHGELNLQSPPAVMADGSGGAYVAWIGDSLGLDNYLQIQRFNRNGQAQWSSPARVHSHNGFHGHLQLIPVSDGGLITVYSAYNSAFISRTLALRISPDGSFPWNPVAQELLGSGTNDMTLTTAVSDHADGVFITLETGSWTDTNIGLFHIAADGSAGEGWTLSGRTVGQAGIRDMMPDLLPLGDGALLVYLTLNDDLATGKLKAFHFTRDGQSLWGDIPQELLGSPMWMQDPQLVSDGSNGFMLAWEDYRIQDTARAYVQRFDGNGAQQWTPGGVAASAQRIDQRELSLASDDQGGAWVAWEQVSAVDEYPDYDLYCMHLNAQGHPAHLNGFAWPENGQPLCTYPTHQRDVTLVPWVRNSAIAIWNDSRSSNPGRCCGAGAVGDIFTNVYGQVLSEFSLAAPPERDLRPGAFEISAVYPNPFNPETIIEFQIQKSGDVRVSVLNILGQEVQVLQSGPLAAGAHLTTWNAADFPSGIYFAKLQSFDQSVVQKLVLLK